MARPARARSPYPSQQILAGRPWNVARRREREPPLKQRVVGEQLRQLGVDRRDVGRVTGERGPAERPDPATEERPDIARDEARVCEGFGQDRRHRPPLDGCCHNGKRHPPGRTRAWQRRTPRSTPVTARGTAWDRADGAAQLPRAALGRHVADEWIVRSAVWSVTRSNRFHAAPAQGRQPRRCRGAPRSAPFLLRRGSHSKGAGYRGPLGSSRYRVSSCRLMRVGSTRRRGWPRRQASPRAAGTLHPSRRVPQSDRATAARSASPKCVSAAAQGV